MTSADVASSIDNLRTKERLIVAFSATTGGYWVGVGVGGGGCICFCLSVLSRPKNGKILIEQTNYYYVLYERVWFGLKTYQTNLKVLFNLFEYLVTLELIFMSSAFKIK